MALMQKRAIGLHIRLQNGLQDVIHMVEQKQLSIAQSFLINEQGRYVAFSSSIIKQFVHKKKELGFQYFVHAAYWSSLTNVRSKEFLSLCKESEIAQDLESSGIVVHVGATKARLDRHDQAKYVAEGINQLFSQVSDIPVILENGPHAGRNFGGDFNDFALLFDLIEQKNRVQFCVDTAHAFVYGYDLQNTYERIRFFEQLHTVFKDQTIALLHLNDTQHACASQIDKHGAPGAGILGTAVLQEIMKKDLFKDVPIILELPSSCDEHEVVSALHLVQSWDE